MFFEHDQRVTYSEDTEGHASSVIADVMVPMLERLASHALERYPRFVGHAKLYELLFHFTICVRGECADTRRPCAVTGEAGTVECALHASPVGAVKLAAFREQGANAFYHGDNFQRYGQDSEKVRRYGRKRARGDFGTGAPEDTLSLNAAVADCVIALNGLVQYLVLLDVRGVEARRVI